MNRRSCLIVPSVTVPYGLENRTALTHFMHARRWARRPGTGRPYWQLLGRPRAGPKRTAGMRPSGGLHDFLLHHHCFLVCPFLLREIAKASHCVVDFDPDESAYYASPSTPATAAVIVIIIVPRPASHTDFPLLPRHLPDADNRTRRHCCSVSQSRVALLDTGFSRTGPVSCYHDGVVGFGVRRRACAGQVLC